jgi:DNA-binding HxlR family transcriptional regulator
MFGNRGSCGESLAQSEEGIASNSIADRLRRPTASGLLTRRPEPENRQKGIYGLAEAVIQLVPPATQRALSLPLPGANLCVTY